MDLLPESGFIHCINQALDFGAAINKVMEYVIFTNVPCVKKVHVE